MKAIIVLNFKVYKEAVGKLALPLAQKVAKAKKNGYKLVVAPSLLTTREVSKKTNLTVFAQHVDPVSLGAHTGSVGVDELVQMGVKGVILNHSERKLPFAVLKETIELCKSKKLKILVCATTLAEIKKIALLHPSYIAYEPAELVGGEISVTQAKPDIIVKAVEAVKQVSSKMKLLCGAGVHSKEDLGHALLLGAEGVLIGHSVPKAANPRKFLEGMLL
jgi:triosephosphate isomerase (TIM)